MESSDKLFLLDAYALIYRAYYAFIKSPRINSKGLNTSAILGFVNTLEEVLKKERPAYIGVAFDPHGPTFRHEAYPQYKAQREETPECIRQSVPIIKEILEAYHIPVLETPGYEADDVIGTLSVQAREAGLATYMMTPDKDYGQLVNDRVFMYRPKHSGGFEVMGPEAVKTKYGIESTAQVIDLLGLMGDTADNIPGCPGVGEKTAQKLIAAFGSIERLLEETDRLKGALRQKVEANKEQIRFSKFLATIKTDVPIALDLQALERKAPEEAKLRALFEQLEFRTLAARIFGDKPASTASTAEKAVPNSPVQGDLFAIIPPDVQAGSKESVLKGLESLDVDYQLIETEQEISQFVQNMLTIETLAIDTETTGVNPMEARLVGMSFSHKENTACYIPVPADDREATLRRLELLRPLYENEATRKVGQNIKYDMEVLQNYGIHVKGPLFDTMLAHYVLQPELRHNMDYLAEIYLHYRTVHIDELIGPKGKGQKNMSQLSPQEVYRYACEDADVTLKLMHVLEKELRRQGADKLFYEVEMPLVPVLVNMETNGVRLDTEALKQAADVFNARLKEIEQAIYDAAGQRFNIASPKQVGELLFDKLHVMEKPKKTKTGQYITSEEILESLRPKHPVIGLILEHRGLKKLLGTYIEALPQLINPRTGRVHTSFNQAVTATGRLSSSNPNLQNIPIRDEEGKEIRKAFIPDEGCAFFSADYSQIELRIMAHLSGDAHIIEAFRSGQDIHAATAAKIYKIGIEAVTPDMRRKAKTANFGIIYGISVFGLAERMNVPRAEAKELIEGYFNTYPGVKAYMEKSIEVARANGYVETICHRRRYLPDIHSANAVVRGYAERNAINAPIQGSAADIIKVAMAGIYRRFQEEHLQAKMILQVHDELNFSVPEAEREAVQRIVIEEMERAWPMQVPLRADCGWGKNWLEAH